MTDGFLNEFWGHLDDDVSRDQFAIILVVGAFWGEWCGG